MQKKREICEYRDKLDKTLSSPDLTNDQTLKSLLRSQLYSSQECNENILDKRTADVSELLTRLRSVSMTDHHGNSDWKLKHDLEDCRVMYREGLDGSPFHTMLVEGYMDAPLQECLCVSWESTLYKKWWPQFAFPPFKILQSTCLQKARIGEQVCLVRMKVPWPLAERELIVHYFLFEYFKDGLVFILLNTISDLDSIGVSSKEVTESVMSVTPGAVRIDLVGGFVLQKVTPQRSYFRTIGDMDIKLDFVPPSLMNFVTRQLIGNGFRLYKKSVASVAKFDEDYSRALADPLYTKIRQALYSTDKLVEKEPKLEVNDDSMQKKEHENDKEDASENEHVHCRRAVPEIEEEEYDDFEESISSEEGNINGKTNGEMIRRKFCISPEVKQALGTLDRVIYMVRNTTPVHEAAELSPHREKDDHAKQISLLEHFENVPQKSAERQDFSTSMVTQETSVFNKEDNRVKETGEEENGILDKGGKNKSLGRRKRKTRCLAFRSWL
ncbi:Polyketide cyclase/dehydrase/lipid transport superfamily protein [Hirschfeldia incana]|nr:Polyketide cyclase/dehydrase/lipid transport superfamily protein [Hirschfeldia incana]